MRQATHIFRKDLRCLWRPLAIMLVAQTFFTYFEVQPNLIGQAAFASPFMAPGPIATLLLPITWIYLIFALIHQEAIPGHDQFWLTRPYSRKSLFAAKLLFMLICINGTLLVGDCVILSAQEFSPTEHIPGLLWRHVPLALTLSLPTLALATLTRNIGQAIAVVFAILLWGILAGILFDRNMIPAGQTPVDWIGNAWTGALFSSALLALIVAQYSFRRTLLTCFLVPAALLLLPTPSISNSQAIALQQKIASPVFKNTSDVRIEFNPSRWRLNNPSHLSGMPYVTADLPVSIMGLPADLDLTSKSATVMVNNQTLNEAASIEKTSAGYWERIVLPAKLFKSLANTPTNIRILPIVTVIRTSEIRVPLSVASFSLPDGGLCRSGLRDSRFFFATCRWALRMPPLIRAHVDYPGWEAQDDPRFGPREPTTTGVLTHAPFPADLGLSPVRSASLPWLRPEDTTTALASPDSHLSFEITHPLTTFQASFECKSTKLIDYAINLPE